MISLEVPTFIAKWQIGGIYPENCRLLRTDSSTNYALSPDVLSEAILSDIANGLTPFFLCATVSYYIFFLFCSLFKVFSCDQPLHVRTTYLFMIEKNALIVEFYALLKYLSRNVNSSLKKLSLFITTYFTCFSI